MGEPAPAARPITAPLEVWFVDGEQRFVGPAPTPAVAAAITALARRVAASGTPLAEDVDLAAGDDGSPRAVRLTARPVAGGVAVASLALDGLHEAEHGLKRFDMVMRATRDAVYEWDVATDRTWWNRQLHELFGYDPQSTVPSYEAWESRIHPEDRERVLRQMAEVLDSGATQAHGEYRFVRTDDSVGVTMDRGCIERDASGRVVRTLGVMSDITAERAASEALRTSEERFREMTSAIDQVFWLTNHDGSETAYVSPAYETVWGRSCESLYREPFSFLQAIHEDDRPRIEARLPAQWLGDYDETYRVRRPDGTIAWIRDRAFPIRDATGEVVRVAGVATDITAQRDLEQQLAQAQRMESIGRLAGGIAHDFNNLLTVILPSVQRVMARLPAGSGHNADLEAVKDAGERAARLTSQLLTFARRQMIAPALLDLNELARQTERLLRRIIGEHIELETVLEAGLGAVMGDRGQLEQVLVNLALNARDAMPDGGRLTIQTRNVTIGPGQRADRVQVADGEYVMLAVSDTGVGIPSDALPHIFEPFSTTKPAGRGTGLGLATCYGIVQQAGGVILVDTAVGSGTTFKIMLPRAAGHAEASERRPHAVAEGSETVLFVEDDPFVRKVGIQILVDHNYRVLEAAGGDEALRLAASHRGPIHLLVTDVAMPQMNGTELARRLLGLRPNLRVLYTSGYTEDAAVRHGVFEARMAFLPKPYVMETLLAKVRELLDAG